MMKEKYEKILKVFLKSYEKTAYKNSLFKKIITTFYEKNKTESIAISFCEPRS